jgi:DNA repair protein RecN (Recombination protein N)
MLIKLSIENYALIDRLEIDFPPGFSVITGETGAGKSILLGALSLILGQRADTSVLLDQNRKCIVEGIFRIRGYGLEEILKSAELDAEDTLTLRREIGQTGKSRAFVNDTPVNLPILKELGDRLVNIHSQNTIVTLNDADFQLAVLDDYAGNVKSLSEYRESFEGLLRLRAQLSEWIREEERSRNDKDYHRFLLEELAAAGLKETEQEEMEERLGVLNHAEEIKKSLDEVLESMTESDASLLQRLSGIAATIRHLAGFHPSLKEMPERLESDLIDLKDITTSLRKISESVSVDPEETERLSSRLDLIYRLQKKHRVASVQELLKIQHGLEIKIRDAGSLEERIRHLQKEIEELERRLSLKAGSISANRKKVLGDFGVRITEILARLALPDARLRIEHTLLGELTRDGIDSVRFLFSANPGVPMDEISRMASGGELSRLMLSIKSLISSKNLLPTILFDEIDSGVSGETAGKVGTILKAMGETMQVIAITHLPQIAGKGESHYLVFKETEKGTARTFIRKLARDERILEIAKLVSNEKITDAAVRTARELLN